MRWVGDGREGKRCLCNEGYERCLCDGREIKNVWVMRKKGENVYVTGERLKMVGLRERG